ncbi:MAG: hydrogenase maturation nickel metallochaperone HypA [Coriobacteriaceae bacterium]|nr:hydrogenase maturation nickel metallochaperone HypA [Coriobacteriaceae bacterium]
MHEMSIVGNVVKAVVMYAEEEGVERVTGVTLTVGALHDVVDDLMERAFRFLARGTVAEGATLHMNKLALKVRCRHCHAVYEANVRVRDSLACPDCGNHEVDIVQGREFLIENIEVVQGA